MSDKSSSSEAVGHKNKPSNSEGHENKSSNSEAGGHDKSLPDRLSNNPQSPFHDAQLLERGVGVRFNGVDRNNVEEYCVSEGWVRMAVGKTVDRHGNAMTVKYKGKVEPYLRNTE
jgi:hypothetical protein